MTVNASLRVGQQGPAGFKPQQRLLTQEFKDVVIG